MELLRGERDLVRIGHRGAAGLAGENSLAAIEAAAAHGADAVELDVRRRADGTLVLEHNRRLRAGSPRLDEALGLAGRLGLAVQLDVKAPGIEAAVIEALRRSNLFGRAFLSSCSLATLAAFAQLAPHVPRAVIYPEDRFGISGSPILRPGGRPAFAAMRALLPRRLPHWLRGVGASAATLNWRVVTPAAIAACHTAGAAVYVWTVNDPLVVQTLVQRDIDGIISDDPRILGWPKDPSSEPRRGQCPRW
jgi:glycerophosphoryl diester phosphodiesterase